MISLTWKINSNLYIIKNKITLCKSSSDTLYWARNYNHIIEYSIFAFEVCNCVIFYSVLKLQVKLWTVLVKFLNIINLSSIISFSLVFLNNILRVEGKKLHLRNVLIAFLPDSIHTYFIWEKICRHQFTVTQSKFIYPYYLDNFEYIYPECYSLILRVVFIWSIQSSVC